jgi:hypothetical protein
MFASKDRAYPSVCAPGHTHKHYTRLEKPAGSKHSSLLALFLSYEETETLGIQSQISRLLLNPGFWLPLKL